MFLWQSPQTSYSRTRCVVRYGAIDGSIVFPWVLWQSVQATSFLRWRPDSQNARCRCPPWQLRQTADFSSAGEPLCLKSIANLTLSGSSTWADPGPWQLSHPCGESAANPGEEWCVPAMLASCTSWQVT